MVSIDSDLEYHTVSWQAATLCHMPGQWTQSLNKWPC